MNIHVFYVGLYLSDRGFNELNSFISKLNDYLSQFALSTNSLLLKNIYYHCFVVALLPSNTEISS